MKICFGCFEQYDDAFDMCPHCGYVEGTEPEFAMYMRPGTILQERYVIGVALGHGGFSVTYLAWDALLQHKVAIKEYLPSEYATRAPGESRLKVFTGKPGEYFRFGREKFLDEARRLSNFQNEAGVVHVFDCFEENGTAYLVMEYLEGETLSAYLKREGGRLEPEQAISLLKPVMVSLQRIHDSGMIHRDIAPDNIMLLKDGGVRLIDFGAARHAVQDCEKSMTVIIKDGYSPEEQYSSHSVQGPAADVYALSATLYQMVTGVVPPNAMERSEAQSARGKDLLVPPGKYCKALTRAQETAILNGMCLHTQDRTQSVAELYEELTAQTAVQRAQQTIQKREKLNWSLPAKIAAIAAAFVIVAGGAWFLISGKSTKESADDGTFVYSPNIVNLPILEAEKTTAEAQLQLVVQDSDYDAGVERGRILSQNPEQGAKLAPLSDLNATASLGTERPLGEMPVLGGALQSAAEQYLESLGLDASQIETVYEENYDQLNGTVIGQDINPGDTLTDASKVTLRVTENKPSTYPQTPDPSDSTGGSENGSGSTGTVTEGEHYVFTTLRNYAGLPFETVRQELLTQQIYAVQYELVYDQSVPAGSIIRQVPGEGEQVGRYGAVYFTVSLGQEQRTVPDVLYKTQADAQTILASRGFGWMLYDRVYSYVQLGNVAAQSPEGGSTAAPASQITLEISASEDAFQQQTNDMLLTVESLELEVGQIYDLNADMQRADGGAGTIIWSSGNPGIASVDENGVITASAPGTVNITAVLNGCAASCFVTVRDSRPFSLPETIYMIEGESRDLAEGWDIPAENVTWSVWDGQCMRIDEKGVLTGLSPCVSYVCAVYDGRMARSEVIVQDAENCAKVRRFTESTTQQEAEEALRAAGVEFTTTKVSSSVPSGCVADFEFVGHEDDEYYYIGRKNKTKLMISAGEGNEKEPEKEPEKQEPAKKESLSVSVLPDKRTFYIGDTLTTSGLRLQYTDKTGKTQTVSSGFQTAANMQAAGTKQVTVTYKGLTTSYSITIKKPSVKLQKEQIEGGIRLSATTDPVGQAVQWISLNPQVAYFEGSELRAAGAGTATIKASMVYNGVTYSDTTTITILGEKEEVKEYRFAIKELMGSNEYACYDVETDIPGYQRIANVWAVTPAQGDWFQDNDGFLYVNRNMDCTITVLYNYKKPDGSFYSATYKQTAEKTDNYLLDIFLVERTEGRAVYAIKTDIPGCTVGTAAWTVASAHRGGWVDGGQYIVDEAGMENGESYTVTASYTYNGQTYSASCTYTYTEQPSVNVFPVIPDVMPTIRH